jgi:hypothetical protein
MLACARRGWLLDRAHAGDLSQEVAMPYFDSHVGAFRVAEIERDLLSRDLGQERALLPFIARLMTPPRPPAQDFVSAVFEAGRRFERLVQSQLSAPGRPIGGARVKIARALVAAHPRALSQEEIARATGLKPGTVRKSFLDLKHDRPTWVEHSVKGYQLSVEGYEMSRQFM